MATLLHSFDADLACAACRHVLIAEDDAMFRTILRSWLGSWGYQVTIAEDGAKAWKILQEERAPQLLILDWMMPELSGLELCRRIRERNASPYHYILLATAKGQKKDLVLGLEAGADDYLSKPFDREELRARLRSGIRILTLQDEQNKAREELQFQASHDALTGLWNRRAILEMLHREFDIATRSCTIGVMMLDVDHFKKVNDTYGHLAGDAVLKEIAVRLQQTVRSYDLVGRYGGEEFLMVLPSCEIKQARICAERVRAAMAERPILADGCEIPITVSIGTSVVDTERHSERQSLTAADGALYQAKGQGRNRVVSVDEIASLRLTGGETR